MVTHVGIINKGRLLFQGTMEELHREQIQSAFISIETNDTEKAMKIISAAQIVPVLKEGQIIIPNIEKEMIAKLNKSFVENNISVYSITPVKNDLESIFMDLTKN
jgi:ABC-type multidrug transport system ATPase subunit